MSGFSGHWIISALNAVVSKSIASFASLAMTVIVARSFELDRAGDIFFGVAALSVATTICMRGTSSYLVKTCAVAASREDFTLVGRQLISGVRLIYPLPMFATGLLLTHILFFSSAQNDKWNTVLGITGGLFFLVLVNISSAYFLAIKRVFVGNCLANAALPSCVLLAVLSVEIGSLGSIRTNFNVAISLLASVSMLWVYMGLRNRSKAAKYSWDAWANAKRVINPVNLSYFWFISCCAVIMSLGGQIVIGLTLSSADVAVYSVAQRIGLLIAFVGLGMNNWFAPRFAAAHDQNCLKKMRRLYLFSTLVSLLAALPVASIIFTRPDLVFKVFGSHYGDKTLFLVQVFIVAQLTSILAGPNQYCLVMSGGERFVATLNGALTALVLCGVLISSSFYGIYGAVYTVSAGLILQNLIGRFQVFRLYGF